MKYFPTPKRTRTAWGLTESDTKRLDEELARMAKAQAQRQAAIRMKCKAQSRKGTPCRALSEPGKRRCKLHGGLSTGPKTFEGRASISKAQKKRREAWREGKTA